MFTCMDHMKATVMHKMATFEFGYYAILWSVKAVLCIDNACHPTHLHFNMFSGSLNIWNSVHVCLRVYLGMRGVLFNLAKQ